MLSGDFLHVLQELLRLRNSLENVPGAAREAAKSFAALQEQYEQSPRGGILVQHFAKDWVILSSFGVGPNITPQFGASLLIKPWVSPDQERLERPSLAPPVSEEQVVARVLARLDDHVYWDDEVRLAEWASTHYRGAVG